MFKMRFKVFCVLGDVRYGIWFLNSSGVGFFLNKQIIGGVVYHSPLSL